MKPETTLQVEVIRDKLIGELQSPKHSASKFEGAIYDWFTRKNIINRVATQAELDKAEQEVRSLVQAAHQRAIDNLAQELKRPEYAGMTAQDIYDSGILMKETPILVEEQVRIERPKEGDPTEPQFIEIGRTPSPVGRIWGGIPYVYNTPPVEVIQQALNK